MIEQYLKQRQELMTLAREYRREEPTRVSAVRLCVKLARFNNQQAVRELRIQQRGVRGGQ